MSNNRILKALELAANGSEDAIILPNGEVTSAIHLLLKMIEEDPRLLLARGKIKTIGGVEVNNVTIYEFCLGAGDWLLAEAIEPYFAKISHVIYGERERQYARYKPCIDALAKQIELKQPAYDLKPLFNIIKSSSVADIAAILNDPNQIKLRDIPLCKELVKFRNAVEPKKSITIGMHYEHYTTLLQAFDLLSDEWKILGDSKNSLIWQQIIDCLQRGLPNIDRFGFARRFKNADSPSDEFILLENRSVPLVFKLPLLDLDVHKAIFGWEGDRSIGRLDCYRIVEIACEEKASRLQRLAPSFKAHKIKEEQRFSALRNLSITNSSKTNIKPETHGSKMAQRTYLKK